MRILPVTYNFQGLNAYRASRERERVVVGLSIVMPTAKKWGKVEVGLGLGNLDYDMSMFGPRQTFKK